MRLKRDGKFSPETMDLLTLTKPLVLDGRYRIALSGSLLGVSLNDVVLNPVGYTNIYKLYPLDFEEYLWARGVGQPAIDEVKACFKECRPVPDLIHSTFLDYFKEYVLVGGLPAAVDEFVKTKNLGAVSSVHHSIMNGHFSIRRGADRPSSNQGYIPNNSRRVSSKEQALHDFKVNR